MIRITKRKPRFLFDRTIRDGAYSALYFSKTQQILRDAGIETKVTMQFFHRTPKATVCGVEEVRQLIINATKRHERKHLTMYAVADGEETNGFEPIIHISGPYQLFGHLEGLIDGIMARRTTVATRAAEILAAARGKQVIYMADRNDDWINQPGDGYAAYIGGIRKFVTEQQCKYLPRDQVNMVGTMPHALIQHFHGDTLEAARHYVKSFPNDPLTALVDYNNDVVNDATACLKELGPVLNAVRIDTSMNMMDKSLIAIAEQSDRKEDFYGVNHHLIKKLRDSLDQHGGKHVKIVVSSSITPEKMNKFNESNTPVDIYGIGGYFLDGKIGFTGDLVKIGDKQEAKAGREFKTSSKLVKFSLLKI